MTDSANAGLYLVTFTLMSLWAVWCLRRLQRHAFIAVVAGGYAVIYGLVPLLRILTGLADDGSSTVAVACGLGGAGLLVGWRRGVSGHRRRTIISPAELLDRYSRRRFLIACVTCAALGFAATAITSAGSIGAFVSQGRFETRGEGGLLGAVIGPLMMRVLIVPVFLLAASPHRRRRTIGVLLGVFSAAFIFAATSGSRSLTLGLLGAAGVGVAFARARSAEQAHRPPGDAAIRSLTRLLIGILAIVSMGVLLSGLYEARKTFRSDGTQAVSSSLNSAATFDTLTESEPFTYSQYLEEAAKTYPQDHPYLWLYPVRRLVFAVPVFGDLKPPDTNLVFAESIGVGSLTTIPPTLPGEGYVVLGGLVGVFPWTFLYGFLIGRLSTSSRSPLIRVVMLAAAIDQGLLALRGQLYESTASLLALFLISMVLWETSKFTMGTSLRRTAPVPMPRQQP